MKPRKFVALALVTLAAVSLAIVLSLMQSPWGQVTSRGTKLAPALTERNVPATIAVTSNGATLTLVSRDANWSLKERDHYPADIGKVRTLLVGLAQAELIEPKTQRPDRHTLLDLEDPTGADAKSRGLKLLDGKGGVMADLIIGKRRLEAFGSGRTGSYVRKTGENQTWLSSADLDFSSSVRDWIETTLFEAEAADIRHMRVEIPGEEALVAERGEEQGARAAFADMPEGQKLKDNDAAETLVRALRRIEADDVRKSSSIMSGHDVHVVSFKMRDGLEGTMRMRREDGADNFWLQFAVSGEGDAKARAEELTNRLSGWEFKLPAGKTNALLKRRAELFEAG